MLMWRIDVKNQKVCLEVIGKIFVTTQRMLNRTRMTRIKRINTDLKT
jgi:hypothetical protein